MEERRVPDESVSALRGLLGDDELAFLGGRPDPAGPETVAALLEDPVTYERLMEAEGLRTAVGPRAVFAVVVYRAFGDLAEASFVPERVRSGVRLPVFDVGPLRELGDDHRRRVFLIDLLTSFARLRGGVRWERTARGLRRRRWSELDPLAHLEVIEQTAPPVRGPALRRAGDVALFLGGVFPEATTRTRYGAGTVARLAATAGVPPESALEVVSGEDGVLALYEVLGTRWYREAAERLGEPTIREMADRFVAARRFLGYVADRHLFPEARV